MAPRYVCLDFETNGFARKDAPQHEWPLPWSNFPIQVSVDIVEDGQVQHAYDSLISGATQFAPWVHENVPVSVVDIERKGKTLRTVVVEMAALLQEGDTIVAHNVLFDLNTALARRATRACLDTGDSSEGECPGFRCPELRRILAAPRFCTMRCAYWKGVFKRPPKLHDMCDHFQVVLKHAHDATGDSAASAECVAEALRRGVMF